MNTNNTLDLTPHFALDGDQPFKDRRAMMPFRGAIPVAKEQLAQTWQEMINQTVSPRKRLVYLHIPFCATHCTFCGFYQNRFNDDACAHYTDALIREIEMEADSVLHQSAPIHAVYFGGGTPSALSAHDLARIITTLREKLPLAPDCEITIEGRVLNFDAERIDACLDAGANRFSIGIQSFNSKIRKKMARTSDGPTAIAFMESLVKRDRAAFQKKTVHSSAPTVRYRQGKPRKEEYLLVDGYNIIFSWEELNELAKENIHAACDKLMDILSNYQGYRKCTLILVFDAYKVEGHMEEVLTYHNIYVVYTKEAETADQYIEKTVHRIGRQYQVTVATSDGLEQVIIMGQGAHRISAQGLKKEIEDTEKNARAEWHQQRRSSKTYLFDNMSEELQAQMEKIRLGEAGEE